MAVSSPRCKPSVTNTLHGHVNYCDTSLDTTSGYRHANKNMDTNQHIIFKYSCKQLAWSFGENFTL